MVGLPDKAVGESRERVRGALGAIGLALPPKRIIVNLAPADLLKEGSHFDLPIALGLLGAMGVLPADELARFTALGELGLDGTHRAGRRRAAGGDRRRCARAAASICPAAQGGEAAWAGDLEVLAPPNLLALINHFKGTQVLAPPQAAAWRRKPTHLPDLARHQGPGDGQARARGGGRRRPQPADDRPARRRQVDAGGAPARPPAAARSGRGAGGRAWSIRSPAS